MKNKQYDLPAWIPEQLRDDPKKLALLGVLMVVFTIVMFRTFTNTGPSNASAAMQVVPESDPITQVLPPNFLNPSYRPTEERINRTPVQNWLNERMELVSRDLFQVRIEKFPRLSDKNHGSGNSQVVGTWDTDEKSQSIEADQKNARIEALQTEAGKLKLQSTIMGRDPMAIVDGEVIKVGSVIKSGASDGLFKVVSIQPKSIVIERDGIRLKLQMPD